MVLHEVWFPGREPRLMEHRLWSGRKRRPCRSATAAPEPRPGGTTFRQLRVGSVGGRARRYRLTTHLPAQYAPARRRRGLIVGLAVLVAVVLLAGAAATAIVLMNGDDDGGPTYAQRDKICDLVDVNPLAPLSLRERTIVGRTTARGMTATIRTRTATSNSILPPRVRSPAPTTCAPASSTTPTRRRRRPASTSSGATPAPSRVPCAPMRRGSATRPSSPRRC